MLHTLHTYCMQYHINCVYNKVSSKLKFKNLRNFAMELLPGMLLNARSGNTSLAVLITGNTKGNLPWNLLGSSNHIYDSLNAQPGKKGLTCKFLASYTHYQKQPFSTSKYVVTCQANIVTIVSVYCATLWNWAKVHTTFQLLLCCPG